MRHSLPVEYRGMGESGYIVERKQVEGALTCCWAQKKGNVKAQKKRTSQRHLHPVRQKEKGKLGHTKDMSKEGALTPC